MSKKTAGILEKIPAVFLTVRPTALLCFCKEMLCQAV